MKKTIKRQDILRDDPLSPAESALFWLQNNASKIVSVLAVGALVFAGFTYINTQNRNREAMASDLYFYAETEFRLAASKQWGSEERAEALARGRGYLNEILERFPNSPISRTALFMKGNSFFNEGDPIGQPDNTREALRFFTQFDDRVQRDGDRFERAAAQIALGNTQENLWLLIGSSEAARDALAAALNHYDAAIAVGEEAGFLRFEAMNSKARILAFQGRIDEAIELYKDVMRGQFRLDDPLREDTVSVARRFLLELKEVANSGTLYATAKIQLDQLGVDVQAFEAELIAEAEAALPVRARRRS